MLVNPKTGRKILINGPTHKKLLLSGELTNIIDSNTQCPIGNNIYSHPDVYRIVLSFTVSDINLVKNLKRVNKRTYSIVSSIVSDKQLVKMEYNEIKKKIPQKYNPFTRLLVENRFPVRFMKNLFLLYPLDMVQSLALAGRWSTGVILPNKPKKFIKATGITNRYEILREIYRYIQSLDSIPESLMGAEILYWPNTANLACFSREGSKTRIYSMDGVIANITFRQTQLPSLVQDDVLFTFSSTFIPTTIKDLSFLSKRIE